MSYATGHNSFTSQYLLNIYIYCRFCRLCIIHVNVWKKNISRIKSSFHSRTLATNSPLHTLPYRILLNCQHSTNWIALIVFLIPLYGPNRKHRFPQSFYCCHGGCPTISLDIVSAITCLQSRCLETGVCFSAYCIATAVLVRFEVSAQQRVYTPQYILT
jgi:hypothetical protein